MYGQTDWIPAGEEQWAEAKSGRPAVEEEPSRSALSKAQRLTDLEDELRHLRKASTTQSVIEAGLWAPPGPPSLQKRVLEIDFEIEELQEELLSEEREPRRPSDRN
jgi:hypothetical protein